MRTAHALPWTALVLVSVLSSPALAARSVEIRPTAAPILVDGDPSDWEGIPPVLLEDSLHALAITHDQNNLYLMYRFADERLARELLHRGVLFWLNGDGKCKNKDERYGVRYAGSSEIARAIANTSVRAEGPRDTGPPPERRVPPGGLPSGSTHILPDELTVVRLGVKETLQQGPDSAPAAASAAAGGSFCYELRIPISELGGKVAAQPPSKRRRIAIGVQVGGLTDAERELIEGSRGGGAGGPTGRPPGGGMGAMGGPAGMGGMGGLGGPASGGSPGGGRPGGGPGEARGRSDTDIVWLQLVLEPAGEGAR